MQWKVLIGRTVTETIEIEVEAPNEREAGNLALARLEADDAPLDSAWGRTDSSAPDVIETLRA